MRAGPKTVSVVVFLKMLLCGQVLAAGQQRDYTPPDGPVSVVNTQSQGLAGSSSNGSSVIKSCLSSASPSPSFRVRFQKLKGKKATYTRTLQKRGTILTFASKLKSVSTADIANCVNAADAGGFVGFTFNDGTCDMFNMEYQTCGCKTEGQDVFYIQSSFWDPKDSKLPEMAYTGVYAIAVVHLPSTVYDEQHLFVGRQVYRRPENQIPIDENAPLNCAFDMNFNCICKENICHETVHVDIPHCVPKSCDAPGNTTILQLMSNGPDIISNILPTFYILSECGKTIVLEPDSYTGSDRTIRVMSHQGYGCQWYPKDGTDHECVVSFTSGKRASVSTIEKFEIVLDGNPTTCEGDTLSIHDGAPTTSRLPKRWDACTVLAPDEIITGTASSITFVFKRTAKQYQADGFNWGFTVGLFMSISS